MAEIITVLAFLGFLGGLIWLIMVALKRKPKKAPLSVTIASFVIMIIAASQTESPTNPKDSFSPLTKMEPSNASELSTTPCPKKVANEMVDTLILYYLKHKIYDPVVCDKKKINENWFIFCHPVGVHIGGLYLLRCDNSGRYIIYAVNGKAKTHAKRGLPAEPIYDLELEKLVGLDTFQIMKKFE